MKMSPIFASHSVCFAPLHVVNQQKVWLIPEVFKPKPLMAVYDTVVEA